MMNPAYQWKNGWYLCVDNGLKSAEIDSSGQGQELKTKIKELKVQDCGPPKILKLKGCTVNDTKNYIGSTLSSICIVMKRHVIRMNPRLMDRYVKWFLSNIHCMQLHLRGASTDQKMT